MIALTRRLLPAILIALAVVALIPIARANGRNLQVLHAVDMSRPDPLGVLTLKSTALLESSLWQRTAGPCLDIWQSRLLASYEMDEATRLFSAFADCPRYQQGQLIWRGNLGLLRGVYA
ncbi:MAG: hypothetical protein R3300_16435, partial [Candidatus Promineifilaceae bacterium]|nr:hypothetical protein [Candidatus Promineifilaceae bacterium]